MTRTITAFAALALAASLTPPSFASDTASADAQRRGGGGSGGAHVRNTSHASINNGGNRGGVNRNAGGNRNANINRNNNVNRNTNINRNNNVNVNRNVNVDVHGGGYYNHGGCYGCDWDDHDFGRGLAVGAVTGAVVGAAVASSNNTTTVVVSPGTVVTTLPSGCSGVSVGGITYRQCGSVWYQPRYAGNTVEYIVVGPPM